MGRHPDVRPLQLAAAVVLVLRRLSATRGASAEQGDNEHIPPFASLRRFIPPDQLWPINDTWYFHAGSDPGNAGLAGIRRIIDRRYGMSTSAQMFADKAQLAHYENTAPSSRPSPPADGTATR